MNSRISILFVIIISFIFTCTAQVTSTKVDYQLTQTKLDSSEVILNKTYEGQIKTTIDSSLNLKFKSDEVIFEKYSLESKFFQNIGYGNKINPIQNEIKFNYPEGTYFEGFEMVDNANYALSNIDVEEGLPNNNVTKTYQDSKGNVWIGYASGEVSKLQSNKIINFSNSGFLSAAYVTDIIEFEERIWISTLGGGISILDGDKIIKLNILNKFPSDQITSFCQDYNGSLWITTEGKGIIRYSKGDFFHYNTIHASTNPTIYKVVADTLDNSIWLFDKASNILKIDNSFNVSIINIVNRPINYNLVDITFNGQLYAILDNNRIAKFGKKVIEIAEINSSSSLTHIKAISPNKVWMGDDGGEVYILKDNSVNYLQHENGLGNSPISDLFLGKSNSFWISTIGNGIYRSTQASFINVVNEEDSFYINNSSICNFNGNLAFTSKLAVSIINQDNITVHYSHKLLKDILGITSDGTRIWLASLEGLYEISNDSLFSYKSPLASQKAYNASTNVLYHNNTLIVNHNNYGWYERNTNNLKWYKFMGGDDLSFTSSMFIDSKGRNWISSTKGGICFKKDNQIFSIKKDIGIINDYCEDEKGNIWIVSNDGLYQFDESNSLFKLNFNEEITTQFNSVLYAEEKKAIWIGSNTNLLLLSLNDLTLNIFNKESGINGSSYAQGECLSINGLTYWVTNNAIVKHLPFMLKSMKNRPEIHLTEIKFDFENVDFEQLKKEEQIEFKELINAIPTDPIFQKGDRSINFIFTSNQWSKESSINYYYRLSSNSAWVGPILNGQITLNNLPLGKHILEVKGIGFNQLESNTFNYEFSITQPFYKDIWFITLVIGIIILIGVVVFTTRSNFDISNFKSYSSYTTYVKRLRFLAFAVICAFPILEWATTEVMGIISPNWPAVILVSMIGVTFLLISYLKKVSETFVSIFALVISLSITLFTIHRLSVEEFTPLLSIELIVIISFSTIVFDNMRLFLVYWTIVVSVIFYSGMSLNYQSNNEALYLIGSILILFFAFAFQIFQVNKIGKIVFSDKILNTYDKLILVYNNQGEVVYVNPYLNQFFEKEDNYILGNEWYKLRNCNSEDAIAIKKDIAKQIETNRPSKFIDENIYSPHLKSERLINWTFQIIENEYLMATGSDVTEMRAQEARISVLSKVTESVSNGVVIRNEEDKIIWCNESFEKLIEQPLSELLGKRPSKSFNFPDFYKPELAVFEEKQGQNLTSLEIPILRSNGDIFWLLMNETVIYDANGKLTQYISIVSDITENKRKEVEIKELSMVAQSVTNGVIITAPNGEIKWCNESFERITGYTLHEIKGHRPSVFMKTPDFFKDELEDFVKNGPKFKQSKRVAHYNKNGDIIWLLVNPTPIYNDKNDLVQIIEVITDITDQKNKEEAYERLSLVAQHSQNPIIIMNDKMEIEWVNGAFVKEFEYEKNEALGNLPGKLLKGEKSDLSKFTKLEKVLEKGKKGSGEFLLYNKTGKAIWVQVSVDPVYNKKEEIEQYICLMQNIQNVKEAQKIIEAKNKDITDSINYAKRIQSAILPNLKIIKRNLPEHFMLYRPKDVVSGDFYYMEFSKNKLIVAIADCTGHGVPGAMMTSIGAAGLNNAILDKKLSDPADILEHLDVYIKNSLSASSEDISDGMDVGIIAFNFKTRSIEYCGAKRPLILVNEAGELSTIPGIKRSIGEFNYDSDKRFRTEETLVESPISIYCYSDGIPDQFGGDNNKKLYMKTLNDFLVANSGLTLPNQLNELEEMLARWTNNNQTPQTDDIVLFGAKVTANYFDKMQKLID